MIMLHFSECCVIPEGDKLEIVRPPRVWIAGEHYERVLRLYSKWDAVRLATYDELCVLVAQYLRRTQNLKIELVSWCHCLKPFGPRYRAIPLDDDGYMTVDPFHGFFNQRLKYLR